MNLHVLNSTGALDALIPVIQSSFKLWGKLVSSLLRLDKLDVVVYADPACTLPETGLGGYTPTANRVTLAIDPSHQPDPKKFASAFGLLLAHEFHHAARWRTVGYGTTLREAMVSEGLACMFESELPGGRIPFYAKALDAAAVAAVRSAAGPVLDSTNYNHHEWFYGDGSYPRHAGYSLGYEVVKAYGTHHSMSAGQLVNARALDLYE